MNFWEPSPVNWERFAANGSSFRLWGYSWRRARAYCFSPNSSRCQMARRKPSNSRLNHSGFCRGGGDSARGQFLASRGVQRRESPRADAPGSPEKIAADGSLAERFLESPARCSCRRISSFAALRGRTWTISRTVGGHCDSRRYRTLKKLAALGVSPQSRPLASTHRLAAHFRCAAIICNGKKTRRVSRSNRLFIRPSPRGRTLPR